MIEVRCPNCKKMLLNAENGKLEIKCNKCKFTWFVEIRNQNIETRVSRTPDK